MLDKSVKESLEEMKRECVESYDAAKKLATKEIVIDDIDLDGTLVNLPKLSIKYNQLYCDSLAQLKDLYALKDKVSLERWKYWMGKQTDAYYKANGIVHDKILKSDVEKYLAADEKMILVNSIITSQKALVDFYEKSLKEIQSMNFHIRAAIDWRKFTSGG